MCDVTTDADFMRLEPVGPASGSSESLPPQALKVSVTKNEAIQEAYRQTGQRQYTRVVSPRSRSHTSNHHPLFSIKMSIQWVTLSFKHMRGSPGSQALTSDPLSPPQIRSTETVYMLKPTSWTSFATSLCPRIEKQSSIGAPFKPSTLRLRRQIKRRTVEEYPPRQPDQASETPR